jgi:hypothetical protein
LSQKWWRWATIGGVKSCCFEVDFWAATDGAFQPDFLPYFWEWKSRCKSREEIWDLRFWSHFGNTFAIFSLDKNQVFQEKAKTLWYFGLNVNKMLKFWVTLPLDKDSFRCKRPQTRTYKAAMPIDYNVPGVVSERFGRLQWSYAMGLFY